MRFELKKARLSLRKKALALLAITGLASLGFAQTAYFVDGFHGGVYGHYPDWNTQFMVDMLKQHPRWKINLEIEPETWDRVSTNTPSAYQEFKDMVKDQSAQGRIEFVNPAYGQSYLWNISGESVIRQLVYGMRKIRDHFPGAVFTTYSSEEPCFTSSLPGLLKSLGFKYAVLKNPDTCWGGYTRAFGGEWLNWVGPDGTSIPAVPRYAIEALQAGSTWQTIAWNNSPQFLEAARQDGITHPVGMCLQDAGWKKGPWLGEGNNKGWSSEYVTWRGYFQNDLIGKPLVDWRLSQEDILVSLVWGSQVLQRIAQQVRAAENKLIMAEKLATLAAVYSGAEWPQKTLDEAWRNLLLAQHHDCWIVPYNGRAGSTWADKVALWTGVAQTNCDTIVQASTSALAPVTARDDSFRIRVFNTLGENRKDLVNLALPADWTNTSPKILDSEGVAVPAQVISEPGSNSKSLLFNAQVPALGYGTFKIQNSSDHVSNSAIASIHDDGTCVLDTDLYRIVVDPSKGGIITGLRAKSLDNREFVDLANARRFNELRGFFYEEGAFHSSAETPALVKILENGPVRSRLEITGKLGIHPFTQILSVVQGQRRIDFSLQVDWVGNPGLGNSYGQKTSWNQQETRRAFYDDRDKLLVLFPANLKNQRVFKNAPFDVTQSKLPDTFFSRWDDIKNNIILNWVDLVEASGDSGLALLTDHTTSYTHGPGHPLGLVLNYSGIGLWGRRYTIKGPTSVRYALVPHKGRWDQAKIETESARWNEPLVPVFTRADSTPALTSKSLLDLTGTGWEVTTTSMDKKDLLVRIFNAEGDGTSKRVRLNGRCAKAELVELDGTVQGLLQPLSDNEGRTGVEFAIPRFAIRTLRFTNVSSNF